MIGILLLTHENFGAAMLKSAELIVGGLEQVRAIGLNRGEMQLKAWIQVMAYWFLLIYLVQVHIMLQH